MTNNPPSAANPYPEWPPAAFITTTNFLTPNTPGPPVVSPSCDAAQETGCGHFFISHSTNTHSMKNFSNLSISE